MTAATLENLSLAESIAPSHYEEWRKSGVSDEIIRANVKTLYEQLEVDRLLNKRTKRMWHRPSDLVPCWCVTGVDPLTDMPTPQGVQVKPNTPRINEKGKPVKYEGARDAETAPLFLDTGKEGYWTNILEDVSQNIFICEGAKKAGALLSNNYAGVSIPGVTTCRKRGRLHQNLEIFAKVGRVFYLCFDNDILTKKPVQDALRGMGAVLKSFDSVVKVIQLPPGEFKGVDDYIAAFGAEAFQVLVENAVTIQEWVDEIKEQESEDGDDVESLPKLLRHYHLIKEQWGERLRLNNLTKEIELNGATIDVDEIRLTIAEEFKIEMSTFDAQMIVRRLAKQDEYSPVVEYLDEIEGKFPNPDTSFLDNLTEQYFGSNDPIHSIYLKKFLVAAVARARQPGCKVDSVFMLMSPEQGKYKSTFFEALFGKEFFSDQLGTDIGNKDEKMKISQYWCLEWAEFEAIYRRKDVSALKNFITNREDTFRAPYARKDMKHPRPCVFVGTSNEKEILHDPTGDRRFWIVPVLIDKIPLERVRQDRDKVWAAANALYKSGYQWWLLDSEELIRADRNKEYQSTSYWDEVVEQLWVDSGRPNFLSTEAIVKALGFDTAKEMKPYDNSEMSKSMTRLGFTKSKSGRRVNGVQKRGWEKLDNRTDFDAEGCNPVSDVSAALYNDSSRHTPAAPPVSGVSDNQNQGSSNYNTNSYSTLSTDSNISYPAASDTPPVSEVCQPEPLQKATDTLTHPVTPFEQILEQTEKIEVTPNADKFACPPPDDYYRDFPVKPMKLVVESAYGDITVDCTPYQKIKAGGNRLHFLYTFPSGDRAAITQKCDSMKKQDLEKMLMSSNPVKKFCQAQYKLWSKRIGEKFKVNRMNLDLHSAVDFEYVSAELTQVPNPSSSDKFLFNDNEGKIIRMDFREFSAPPEIKKGDRVEVKMMSGVPDNLAYLVCCKGVVRTLSLGVAKVEFDETINFDLHVKSIGVHHLELINE